MEAAGVDTLVWEFQHGDAPRKAELDALLNEKAKAGDEIVVTEVSRISRSTRQLCEVVELIQAKALRLEILGSITVDCRDGQLDPMTAAFIQMAGVFAELELELIRSRVRSGMANARAKGKRIGRPIMSKEDLPAMFLKYYPLYREQQLTKKALAKLSGVSYPTIYRYIDMMEMTNND